MKTLILGHSEVARLMTMRECIGLMEETFKILASGDRVIPLRSIMAVPKVKGFLGVMPGYVGGKDPIMGLKITGVYPENFKTPYDSHQGAVVLFDVRYGFPLAIVDATSITAVRTAAVSAVATKFLARPDASNLALLGSGVQAEKHLEALSLVRPVRKVRVWSVPHDHALKFADKTSKLYSFDIEAAETADEAVRDADIICTVTPSPTPILHGAAVRPGTHINAVGACTASARELDSEAVRRSRLFSDYRESLFNESGDFLIPLKEGVIREDHLIGEIGDVITGKMNGRTSDRDITLFKSLGISLEDLTSARYIYQKALDLKIGTYVEIVAEREEKA